MYKTFNTPNRQVRSNDIFLVWFGHASVHSEQYTWKSNNNKITTVMRPKCGLNNKNPIRLILYWVFSCRSCVLHSKTMNSTAQNMRIALIINVQGTTSTVKQLLRAPPQKKGPPRQLFDVVHIRTSRNNWIWQDAWRKLNQQPPPPWIDTTIPTKKI